MAFNLPFNVSYIVMTPRRVRLPGEPPKSPSSPSKTSGRSPLRWRGDLSNKAKSLRSLVGGKSTTTVTPLTEEKDKMESPSA